MSKRKREDLDDRGHDGGNGKASGPDYRRQRQIADTFAQASKQLAAAFRLARAFERQKLGRRKKNAAKEKKPDEITRIDAEVAQLKAVDTVLSAQNFLAKALLKIKAVAATEDLPAELRTPRPVSTNSAALNIHARLCNSNPVKQTFPAAFGAVKKELGIVDTDEGPQTKPKRLRAKDYQAQQQSLPSHDEEAEEELSAEQSSGAKIDSGEELDSSVGDVDDLERRLEEEGISRHSPARPISKRNLAADLSLSEDEELSDVEPPKRAATSRKSTFLPALTMGGYISGSGSEAEDIEESKPKKNRRGQRARQAIWEQKFGTQAKHLQNQDKKKGWDPKRGAVDSIHRGKKGHDGSKFAKAANSLPLGKNRATSTSRPDADRNAAKKPQRDDSGPLHPSWEAAKRAKEKKSVPVAFQGKKISFD